MDEERRRKLGIPIHKRDSEHLFVDGFCACGLAKPKRQKKKLSDVAPISGRTTKKSNIDTIEGNWEAYH